MRYDQFDLNAIENNALLAMHRKKEVHCQQRHCFQVTTSINCQKHLTSWCVWLGIETETAGVVEFDCAMIDVLDCYDPRHQKAWWRQLGDEGTKLRFQH
jgi:hypothetical protein